MENNSQKREKNSFHQLFPFSRRKFILFTLLFAALLISTTSCITLNDPESSQEINSDQIGTLNSATSIGQTFTSRRSRLNGITIWLFAVDSQNNTLPDKQSSFIDLELFHFPTDQIALYKTRFYLQPQGKNIPVTINFPVQGNNSEENYYLQLKSGTKVFKINGRNEDIYPHGQFYINQKPINADIAFRLSYDYDFQSVLDDIRQASSQIWLVFPLLAILWLPGWLLLEFSGLPVSLDFGERTALSVGISLAVIPLLMLWTTVLGIAWTKTGVILVSILLAIIFIVHLIYRVSGLIRNNQDKNFHNFIKNIDRRKLIKIFHPGAGSALLVIFFLALTIRLIMVRDLATPAWVDSIHHALITQLIISHGSYPTNYLPYFDFSPASYHPGFHSIAAAFTWLSNLDISKGLLLLGQVLNAMPVFSVYLFAKKLTNSSNSALIAAILTGFLTPMPAYYTSWSRYTELAGLVILPAAIVLVTFAFNHSSIRQNFWTIILIAITSGGLFMVHYRVLAFLMGIIVCYLIIYYVIRKIEPLNLSSIMKMLLLAFLMCLLLVFPWFLKALQSTISIVQNSTQANPVPLFSGISWAYLTAALGKQTLVFAGLGLIWGMIRLKRFAYLLLTWIILLFTIAMIDSSYITGGSLITSASIEIMLFIPISILGGYFVEQVFHNIIGLTPKRLQLPVKLSFILIISSVAWIGARQLIMIINPSTILSRQADLPAIEWIKTNIPENETIVINPFLWGYGVYAGSDGGYWISPITGRPTLPPPVLYSLDKNRNQIVEQCEKVIDLSSNPVALKEFLYTNQFHHIYVGSKGGVLSPKVLVASGLFTTLYHQDGVWIFGVKP